MGKVGRKIRKAFEGIFQPLQHFVQRDGQLGQFGGHGLYGKPAVQTVCRNGSCTLAHGTQRCQTSSRRNPAEQAHEHHGAGNKHPKRDAKAVQKLFVMCGVQCQDQGKSALSRRPARQALFQSVKR